MVEAHSFDDDARNEYSWVYVFTGHKEWVGRESAELKQSGKIGGRSLTCWAKNFDAFFLVFSGMFVKSVTRVNLRTSLSGWPKPSLSPWSSIAFLSVLAIRSRSIGFWGNILIFLLRDICFRGKDYEKVYCEIALNLFK